MNFYFPQHVLLPHVILRKADGEVAESMRQNPRIDMDSATPGKPSVQNDMIGCCSGLVIGRHEHDDPTLNLPDGYLLPKEEELILFEKMDSATSFRITSRAGDRMEVETSSVEVSVKNHVK